MAQVHATNILPIIFLALALMSSTARGDTIQQLNPRDWGARNHEELERKLPALMKEYTRNRQNAKKMQSTSERAAAEGLAAAAELMSQYQKMAKTLKALESAEGAGVAVVSGQKNAPGKTTDPALASSHPNKSGGSYRGSVSGNLDGRSLASTGGAVLVSAPGSS